MRNEGGVQENFDILPLAQEEAYLRTYPEERKGRAFLEFCKDGDLDAIVHLVRDHDEDENEVEGEAADVLRYCGNGAMTVDGSGLHLAIENGRVEVAWLLLFLASRLEIDAFPPGVLAGAQSLGLEIQDRKPDPDIRTLKNSHGLHAVEVAQRIGGQWLEWVDSGRLAP